MQRPGIRDIFIVLALAAVYFVSAKLGLAAALTAKQVTLIWPPTGIALAAIILFGPRVWPGIFLGAFAANILTEEPFLTALGIACGNTLEALVGVWLLRRFISSTLDLNRLKDAYGFLLCGVAAPALAATIGSLSLCLGHVQPWEIFGNLWLTWWMGDMLGAFIVAPFILVWSRNGHYTAEPQATLCEALLLGAALALYCTKVFINLTMLAAPLVYFIFLFVIWSAIRFGQRGTTLLTLIVSAMTVWSSLEGLGPFVGQSVTESLVQIAVFMTVISSTGLLLSATMSERREAARVHGLLASVVESSSDAIISKTTDGVITSWNNGAEYLFGYEAAEALGKHIGIIFPEGKSAEEQDIMNRIKSGKRVKHYDTVRVNKAGQRIDVSVSVSPIFDAHRRVTGASTVVRDITGRKAAEKKLASAQKYLEDILNHIPDPIFIKDRQHRWIGGNAAFWQLMNGPPEKFIGKSDYDFFPKAEADHFWGVDDRVFSSGKVDISEEPLTDAKGELHVLSTKKTTFLDDKNEQFLVGVIRDITQLKKTEERITQYAKELERSNQDLDDFAYIASHDMKEPLRGLQTFSKILLESCGDRLDGEAVEHLQRICFLSGRLNQLVEDLLYYSRLGRAELAVQAVNPDEIVADLQKTMETTLKEANALIVVPRPMPQVVCDKPGLMEVLRNLVTNAVKYNDKDEKIIEISFDAAGSVFCVKDNGIGIDPQFHASIFQMFRRLQDSCKYDKNGTGAGLSFVKKIVERNKGKIWLESTPGQGTAFYFTMGASLADKSKRAG